jgi:hypothetical protein
MISLTKRRAFRSLLVVLALALAAPALPAASETLEDAFVRQGKGLIQRCKEKGYKNVGVLKFQVSTDGKTFSDNVGTMNMLLARRLEVALVVGNDARAPVGIIRNASAVAAHTRGANHLSRQGREVLFEPSYHLAWGKTEVKADAFITGAVGVSKDRKSMLLQLYVIDREENRLAPFGKPVRVRNEANKLAEMGQSFTLRGVFDRPNKKEGEEADYKESKALEQAAAYANAQPASTPAAQKVQAVSLTVRYNGKPVPMKLQGGKFVVPEPSENTRVDLVLKRGNENARYGVVVKVNGESTIFRQKLPELQCRKWILEPGAKPFRLEGFQLKNNKLVRFKVLSPYESANGKVNYGEDVGQITMTVFREATSPAPTPNLLDPNYKEKQSAGVVKTAELPEDKENYGALLASLQQQASRGLLGSGEAIDRDYKTSKFTPDPTPVQTLTVVYFKR